jgi:hypothetical protein
MQGLVEAIAQHAMEDLDISGSGVSSTAKPFVTVWHHKLQYGRVAVMVRKKWS